MLAIPRRVGGRNLREFILNQVKKLKRNQKRVGLQGEVAYSKDHVYIVFPGRALELSFALSILFKCRDHNIPCALELSHPAKLEDISREVLEAAEAWCRGKLPRRFYALRDRYLGEP